MSLPTFIAQVGALAQREGLNDFVVVIRDPATGEVGFYGPAGSLERLRDAIIDKLGVRFGTPTDVEWPSG